MASMDVDPEIDEPILHVAGFKIREAVQTAITNTIAGKR
jgi:hypothetical protein